MELMTKEKFCRIGVLTLFLAFYALCLTPGHLRTVFAQEVEVRVKLDAGETRIQVTENVEDIEDVIVIDNDIIYIDMETPIDEGETETPSERNMESQENEQPDEKFPPEVKEMMEKEGVTPEDLMNDPELRKKFRKKVEKRMGKKDGEDSPSDGKPGKGKGEPEEGKEKVVVGLERYTSIIVKKNLFRNLGSGDEKKKTSYALTAVISDSSGESRNKAIIEQQGGGASYYVYEGDTFADEMEVIDIEDKLVKLNKSGEEMTLTLGEGSGGSGGGGGHRDGGGGRRGGGDPPKPGGGGGNRRGGRRGRGGGGRGGGGFDASKLPPFARKILEDRGISIEELQNNPELQRELRREFRGRFSGGDGVAQPVRIEIHD